MDTKTKALLKKKTKQELMDLIETIALKNSEAETLIQNSLNQKRESPEKTLKKIDRLMEKDHNFDELMDTADAFIRTTPSETDALVVATEAVEWMMEILDAYGHETTERMDEKAGDFYLTACDLAYTLKDRVAAKRLHDALNTLEYDSLMEMFMEIFYNHFDYDDENEMLLMDI